MSLVWDKVLTFSEKLLDKFNNYESVQLNPEYEINDLEFSWKNYVF